MLGLISAGIGLHAFNQFAIVAAMPLAAAELGGRDWFSWVYSLYFIGSIAGGTSAAYLRDRLGVKSSLFWSMALKRTGGHLHTIDRDPKKYESAKQTFHRAGVAEIVTNYLGDAAEILRNMPAGAGIDIAFIDADKPATQAYFDLLWPKMRTGGSVLVDNATTHRQDLWEFVHAVRNRADARSAEVAVGNGIEWIIKVA